MSDATRVPHSVAVAGQLTAAGRPRRCQHRYYWMTCADYDELEARADGCCERCGTPSSRPWIDHDHSIGDHAVRGLVCSKCNAHMRRIDSGERPMDELTTQYLSNYFQAEKRSVVTVGTRPANVAAPRIPVSTFRIPADLWSSAVAKAKSEGTTATAAVIAGLERYVKSK